MLIFGDESRCIGNSENSSHSVAYNTKRKAADKSKAMAFIR